MKNVPQYHNLREFLKTNFVCLLEAIPEVTKFAWGCFFLSETCIVECIFQKQFGALLGPRVSNIGFALKIRQKK